MQLINKKNNEEKLSGKTESKDFEFWSDKMNKMIEIFEIYSDESIPNENVVDRFSIFPETEVENVKSLFELKNQLEGLNTSKVRFEQDPASKRIALQKFGSFKFLIRSLFLGRPT